VRVGRALIVDGPVCAPRKTVGVAAKALMPKPITLATTQMMHKDTTKLARFFRAEAEAIRCGSFVNMAYLLQELCHTPIEKL
jgi:hypothetical protein